MNMQVLILSKWKNVILVGMFLFLSTYSKAQSLNTYCENLLSTYDSTKKGSKEYLSAMIPKIGSLKQSVRENPNNYTALYLLAKQYYDDFMLTMEREVVMGVLIKEIGKRDTIIYNEKSRRQKPLFAHSADSALAYFYQLWQKNKADRVRIYFPIKQLECYLNSANNYEHTGIFEEELIKCYFPLMYFMNLKNGWECDPSINHVFEIDHHYLSNIKWIEQELTDLKEDCLFDLNSDLDQTVYRFTWLRSFHHPIVVRLEKNKEELFVYWKEGKSISGEEPRGLKKSGKKKISIEEWNHFEKLMDGFDTLYNTYHYPSVDGSRWVLEKSKEASYKACDIYGKRKEACLYLLQLTRLKIKPKEIY